MFGFKAVVAEFFDINVGLSTTMSSDKRHGVFAVIEDDVQRLIPFIADNPKLLIRPNRLVVEKLFKDVIKMGFSPIAVTIEYDNKLGEHYRTKDFSLQP